MGPTTSFQARYREVYRALGVELGPADALPEGDIASAERRLGIVAPPALRAYLLVAGREARLNQALNPLLHPSAWFVDGGHLVFMEENQAVVFWGVPLASTDDDPPVFRGVNGADDVQWYAEHDRVSVRMASLRHPAIATRTSPDCPVGAPCGAPAGESDEVSLTR